ncbi:MAG: hypothetical protein K5892_02580 [Acholeplasmatales bacterium]|nr:hypothetical protein [Acholeplasmatales bacterium]
MAALKEYIIYNWALILVLIAFVIMLIITVFLDKKTKIKMYILIGVVFCFNKNENKNIEEMIRISDEMMYADKREYYKANGIKR